MKGIKVRESTLPLRSLPSLWLSQSISLCSQPSCLHIQVLELKAYTTHVAWRNPKNNYLFLYLYGKKWNEKPGTVIYIHDPTPWVMQEDRSGIQI